MAIFKDIKVYVFGGSYFAVKDLKKQAAMETFTNQLSCYDINKNSWSVLFKDSNQKPNARSHASMHTYEKKDVLIVMGGIGQHSGKLGDLWLFDIKTNKFIEQKVKGENPFKKDESSDTAIIGDQLYLYGGFYKANNKFHKLDLNTWTWSKLNDNNTPDPRYGATLIGMNEKLLIVGGLD